MGEMCAKWVDLGESGVCAMPAAMFRAMVTSTRALRSLRSGLTQPTLIGSPRVLRASRHPCADAQLEVGPGGCNPERLLL